MRSRLDKKTKIEERRSATPCNTAPELRLQTVQAAWKVSEILCHRTSNLHNRPHIHCTSEYYFIMHSLRPLTKGRRQKQEAMNNEMDTYRKLLAETSNPIQ